MEFKKMPASSVGAVSAVDPDTQMHQAMRLMAQRSLHGARGILYIAGSVLLVLGAVCLAYEPSDAEGVKSGRTVFDNLMAGRMGADEWFGVGDVALGVITILCGVFITAMPLAATLLPPLLFVAKVAAMIVVAANTRTTPGLVLPVLQLAVLGATIKAFKDARAYRRDVEAARDHYRSMAILRQKEVVAPLEPVHLPEANRAGTRLPPRKNTPPPA